MNAPLDMTATASIVVTIALTTLSQLLQKCAAVRYAALETASPQQKIPALQFYLREPRFWLAMLCLGSAMLSWLIALSSTEVSKAYAFLSISYLLVPIIATRLFGEHMTPRARVGALLLFIGVVLIGRS